MNDKVKLRPEKTEDIESIDRVVGEAFGDQAEVRLVRLIRERGEALISLVAEMDGEVVGHVMVSPIDLDAPGRFAGVAPLAVSPACQSKGIGGALMREAEQTARTLGIDALFLLGHPNYYPRFGYVKSHIGNEYGAADAFMHLELTPGVLAGVEGVARYVAAFGETGN